MEIYKKIDGFENYEVSNFGNVRNIKTGLVLKGLDNGKGYLRVRLNKKFYLNHILVAKSFLENPDNLPTVDHKNRDTQNNRLDNLRWGTNSQQEMNKGLQSNNTSGYRGVSWHERRQKFRARIYKDGVEKHLGYYDTAEEAHAAYEKEAEILFGEFKYNCEL